ncbi:MAG: hypothetical protein JXB85_04665, partial [Anaerolineales bacterium]|nr:hypothetical protein [Anaerolineales bacterium]
MKWRIGLIAALVSLISLMACNLPATRSSDPVALASVVETTVCRAGPAERFDPVRTFEPGQQVEAVGRSAESDYWLVRAPDDLATLCWLPAGGVTLAGDPGLLPVSTPPVTPTLAATSVEGPTPVIGCPTPVGGGPTPVSCDPGEYAPPAGSGCPTPVGGGPTPASC